mmetsp:Transcript_3782/g.23881  ORF Transcript_3782/g.23881 Transcript_3782/m.23881 type:complete len:306 (+) Transcript_3782:1321-2238(+)
MWNLIQGCWNSSRQKLSSLLILSLHSGSPLSCTWNASVRLYPSFSPRAALPTVHTRALLPSCASIHSSILAHTHAHGGVGSSNTSNLTCWETGRDGFRSNWTCVDEVGADVALPLCAWSRRFSFLFIDVADEARRSWKPRTHLRRRSVRFGAVCNVCPRRTDGCARGTLASVRIMRDVPQQAQHEASLRGLRWMWRGASALGRWRRGPMATMSGMRRCRCSGRRVLQNVWWDASALGTCRNTRERACRSGTRCEAARERTRTQHAGRFCRRLVHPSEHGTARKLPNAWERRAFSPHTDVLGCIAG